MPKREELKGRLKALACGRRLLVERDGSTAVEFSLIALPFLILLIAILQVGVVFLAQHELETAVEKTARGLLTGSTQQAALTQTQFVNSVCSNLPALFNCSGVMVDLQTAANFSSANTATPTLTYDANGNVTNNWQYSAGGSGSLMVLRVIYQFPVLPALSNFNLANLPNGNRLLMATAVFVAEPY